MNQIRDFFFHSGRLVTVVILLVFTFSYAMFQGGFVSWFVFFIILPFSLYSILLALLPIHFKEIARTLSKSHIERGDSVFVTVTFRNTGWIPLIFLTVRELAMEEDLYEAAKGQMSKLFLVGWKREFEWTYELKQLQRGEHYFRGLEFVCTDFFGWTIRKTTIEKPQLFLVYPKVYKVNSIPMRMQYEQGAAMTQYSLIKDTTMATGVREYVPGDRFSWIHWKSFAKNGELRTKEFEDRQTQNTFVLIDRAVQKNFEQVVDYTASYIQKMVKERGEVSFLSTGVDRYFVPIIKTDSQFETVMQHLVTVQPDAQFNVDRLLYEEQKIMNRSVVVIITGELMPELVEVLHTSTSFANKVLCFVVGQQTEQVKHHQIHYVADEWLSGMVSEVRH
ncbi:DUF58 domain-containing protein [Lysinibacillus sp. 2017]|uniref:DUF58 domain-containing protein n=1 Tax=unclassified Lysinibacillus TaxID=2636778 RepID=UPI000D527609|nr:MULTISPECIES: DUF58 domain-containing protein [unclassified Lysinibacillus]AWE08861.1 DUF58 domain-containing protein [Lysinibacillus sp. 2017]TGN34754.1 DUF58 domain-containing protein [Lysinibacillus sp. S2017]